MQDIIQKRQAELQRLCLRHGVKRFELFGSAARMSVTARDYDFLVEFQPQSPSDHARSYFGLLHDLEDLLERPVDLIETPAVTNPFFLRSIADDRRVLYDC